MAEPVRAARVELFRKSGEQEIGPDGLARFVPVDPPEFKLRVVPGDASLQRVNVLLDEEQVRKLAAELADAVAQMGVPA